MTHNERRERRRQVALAVEAGEDVATVARRFGVCGAWVRKVCEDHSVKLAHRSTVPGANSFAVFKAMLERPGDSYAEIASSFGISKQRVEQIARNAEEGGWVLPTRKRGRRPKK